MSETILVALSTFAEYGDAPMKLLDGSGLPYRMNTSGRRLSAEDVVRMGRDCVGIIAGVEPYGRDVLEQLPRLRCISRCGVGTDNICLETARERGIVVRNTPDVVTAPVAELTLAMTLDLLKKLSFHTALLKARAWRKSPGGMLAGRRVGIVGLGRTGRRVAEMMVRLDARVSGFDPVRDDAWAEQTGIALVTLDELLGTSDIVSLHLSVRTDAPFRLDEEMIGKMKAGAVVINVSRGQFIDETALYAALRSGRLDGAGLDVFPQEPYTGPLCDLENVVLTPHLATLTRESRVEMELDATRNLLETLSVRAGSAFVNGSYPQER